MKFDINLYDISLTLILQVREIIKQLLFGSYGLSDPVSLKSMHRISGEILLWSSFHLPAIFERSLLLHSVLHTLTTIKSDKCHQASE